MENMSNRSKSLVGRLPAINFCLKYRSFSLRKIFSIFFSDFAYPKKIILHIEIETEKHLCLQAKKIRIFCIFKFILVMKA